MNFLQIKSNHRILLEVCFFGHEISFKIEIVVVENILYFYSLKEAKKLP
jgi:ABC-type transport system involved in cytochrome c biogenesis ATPase subunit